MVRYKLDWKKVNPTLIIGVSPQLPDNACHFHIKKLSPFRYHVFFAGRYVNNTSERIIANCPQVGRDLCEEYLNENFKSIVSNQAKEISRKSIPSIKPASYYRELSDHADSPEIFFIR